MCHCYLLNLVDLAEGCVSLISLLPPLIVFCYTPPLSSPTSQSFYFSEFVPHFTWYLLSTESARFSTIVHHWSVDQCIIPCPPAIPPLVLQLASHSPPIIYSSMLFYCPLIPAIVLAPARPAIVPVRESQPGCLHHHLQNFLQRVLQIILGLPDLQQRIENCQKWGPHLFPV